MSNHNLLVLNNDALRAAAFQLLQDLTPDDERGHQPSGRISERRHFSGWESCGGVGLRSGQIGQEIHGRVVDCRELVAQHLFHGVARSRRVRRINGCVQHPKSLRELQTLLGRPHADRRGALQRVDHRIATAVGVALTEGRHGFSGALYERTWFEQGLRGVAHLCDLERLQSPRAEINRRCSGVTVRPLKAVNIRRTPLGVHN